MVNISTEINFTAVAWWSVRNLSTIYIYIDRYNTVKCCIDMCVCVCVRSPPPFQPKTTWLAWLEKKKKKKNWQCPSLNCRDHVWWRINRDTHAGLYLCINTDDDDDELSVVPSTPTSNMFWSKKKTKTSKLKVATEPKNNTLVPCAGPGILYGQLSINVM